MKRSYLLLILLAPLALIVLILSANRPALGLPAPAGAAVDPDHQVVRAYFDNREQVYAITDWKAPWEVNYDAGYLVVDADAGERQWLRDLGFRLEVDAALTYQLQNPAQALPNQGGGIPGYPCYRTVEETYATAASIAANYPNLATWIDIGDSWEKTEGIGGYDIMVLRLTNSAVAGPKPVMFVTTSIHAREYAPPEINTRFAEYLIDNYGTDADATWLLNYHEIHLLFMSNPDGRKHAESGAFWRKNTNQNYCGATSSSRGADLNRNFEFLWNGCSLGGCSSGNQCSDTYRGPSAASEPETQAIENYGRGIFPDQRGPEITDPAPDNATGIYFDIHSSGGLVLWPWGFTFDPSPNDADLRTFGRKLAYFNNYTPQQATELYPTDGTTDDFFYGDMGVAAYTFEVGTSFFQSCSSFESTVFPDNLDALVYAAKTARAPYQLPAGPEVFNVSLGSSSIRAGDPLTLTLTAEISDARFNNSNGAEPVQNVVAAEYYIDVPYWITDTTPVAYPMTASDGAFDSPNETATAEVDIGGIGDGTHIIYVRAQDAAGNWGPVSAVMIPGSSDVYLPVVLRE